MFVWAMYLAEFVDILRGLETNFQAKKGDNLKLFVEILRGLETPTFQDKNCEFQLVCRDP